MNNYPELFLGGEEVGERAQNQLHKILSDPLLLAYRVLMIAVIYGKNFYTVFCISFLYLCMSVYFFCRSECVCYK